MSFNYSSAMAPRQDLIIQPPQVPIQQSAPPPPPPAPGRLQRPPHDNPTAYINRSTDQRNDNTNQARRPV